ncbi:MAG TPA: hypothetical protein VHC63_12845 [Acidimicrobiales bacterium]|nr:hypothetical protein [Acidimicrobiales bacterium]
MRWIRTGSVFRMAALVFAAAPLLTPGTAFAQTTTTEPGYPGPATTVAPQPTVDVRDLGPLVPGSVVNVSECNFAPGTTVTIRVQPPGITLAPVVADSNGCITVRIEILRTLVALGSPLHPFAATGLAAAGTKVQGHINGQTVTFGPYGTIVDIVSTGTGSNSLARSVTISYTLAKPGTVTRSGIVRTGTEIVKWTPFGLGLIGIGYLMVLASKRRRNATTQA